MSGSYAHTSREHAKAQEGSARAPARGGEGFFDLNLRTGHAFWSARLRQLLGYREDELPATVHAWFASVIHPEDHSAFHIASTATWIRDARFDLDARLRHANGAVKRYRISGHTESEAGGRRIRIVGAVHDRLEPRTPLRDPRSQLESAVHLRLEQFSVSAPYVALELVLDAPPDPTPGREALRALSDVLSEGLRNVAVHAHASRVTVAIRVDRSKLELEIRDNGVGFDESVSLPCAGLAGMRAHARRAGGTLDVNSVVGVGTRLRLDVPAPAPTLEVSVLDLRPQPQLSAYAS